MATVTYNCTGCVVIDRAVIDAYNILTSTEAYVSSAESDRATAEAARVLVEQGRTQQFSQDHGTAQEDHRIASGDHTLAVEDHGTASDDHILAVADHGTASDDHTASTAATSRANDAAAAAEHMVDIHQGPPGPSGKAPIVGANGNWWTWDDDTEAYEDSGEQAQGPEGDPGATPDISIGTVTTGAAGSPAAASMTGTAEAPVLNLTIPQGIQGNTGSSVDYPYELVNNRTTNDATKGLSAAEGKRLGDDIGQLEQKLNTLALTRYYGVFTSSALLPADASEKGYAYVGASTPLAIYEVDYNNETELWEWVDTGVTINSVQGQPGSDGIGIDDVSSQEDGTLVITLTNGDTVTVDLTHNHPAYYSKAVETSQPSGGFLPDVIYKLGTLTGSVTFALAAAVTGNANHYYIVFDTSSTAPTITWPNGLTWASGSQPTISASKHYEVSILDGVAAIMEV